MVTGTEVVLRANAVDEIVLQNTGPLVRHVHAELDGVAVPVDRADPVVADPA